jgi:hypothetical protein
LIGVSKNKKRRPELGSVLIRKSAEVVSPILHGTRQISIFVAGVETVDHARQRCADRKIQESDPEVL